MKKLLALGVVAALTPSLGLAAGNHPMAGCGLGYLLLSNKDNSKVTQVIGATTNGTFGSQTFGISSGTSGCTEDGAVKVARAAEVYADVNFASLRREMALGQGEVAETFVALLGISETHRQEAMKLFQGQYAALFPTATTSTGDFLNAVGATISQHPELLG